MARAARKLRGNHFDVYGGFPGSDFSLVLAAATDHHGADIEFGPDRPGGLGGKKLFRSGRKSQRRRIGRPDRWFQRNAGTNPAARRRLAAVEGEAREKSAGT